ncbi:hypothetical protein [Streptomyces sp. NPDC017993]|uniref:hypothetical protein n=1 Tax=Streptomyces sp. NPDC017993 TaxID=3365027 RepID=UPI003793C229
MRLFGQRSFLDEVLHGTPTHQVANSAHSAIVPRHEAAILLAAGTNTRMSKPARSSGVAAELTFQNL